MNWFIGRVEALAKQPEDKLIVIFDALHEWFSQPDFRGCAFINAVAETADVAAFEFQISVDHKKRLELYISQTAKAANIRQAKQIVEQLLILVEGSIVRAQMEKTPKSALVAKSMAKTLLAKRT